MLVAALIGTPVLMVTGTLLRGVAIATMWRWFVIPIFHVREIGIAEAVGLAMFVGLFTFFLSEGGPKDYDGTAHGLWDAYARGIGVAIVSPLVAIMFGWVWREFVLVGQ